MLLVWYNSRWLDLSAGALYRIWQRHTLKRNEARHFPCSNWLIHWATCLVHLSAVSLWPTYLRLWQLILCLPYTSNICWASGKVPRLFCTWRAPHCLFRNISICSTIPYMWLIYHFDAHTCNMLCERNTIDTSWRTWHEGQWTASSAYISERVFHFQR